MDATPSLPLVDRLQLVAAQWAAAHEPAASLSRLGKAAVGDGAFFDRLGERGPTTSTLERFARFLADPANWPGGTVPEEAAAFAHVTGVSPATAAAPTGEAGGMSGGEAA